jgi:exosortase A
LRANVTGIQSHVAAVILFVSVFILYFGTWRSMASVWTSSSTFMHCALILPMSGFLIWQMRSAWTGLQTRPSWVGVLLLALCVLAWKLAGIVAVQVVAHFAVVAMLVASVWAVYGFKIVKVLHFPLLYAFFAVPFGEILIPPLMDWTASFTVWALQMTGIPVVREGHLFSLPSGNFRVVEACSGIRFLIVTVVLGLFFAHETFASQRKRLVFVLGAALTVILANGIRAFVVVLVAHYSGMKYGTGEDHIYLGWVIFLLTIMGLFWLGRRYEDTEASWQRTGRSEDGSSESRFAVIPPTLLLVLPLSFTTLAMGPLMSHANVSSAAPPDVSPQLPIATGDWSGPRGPKLSYQPEFVGQSARLAGRYENSGQVIELHVVFYAQQMQGAELIGFQNELFDSDVWSAVPDSEQNAGRLSGLPGTSVTITDGQRGLRIWYWYDIGGHAVSSPTMAKMLQVWNTLTANDVGDAVIVLATPVRDIESDTALVEAFARGHQNALSECLRPQDADRNLCTWDTQ